MVAILLCTFYSANSHHSVRVEIEADSIRIDSKLKRAIVLFFRSICNPHILFGIHFLKCRVYATRTRTDQKKRKEKRDGKTANAIQKCNTEMQSFVTESVAHTQQNDAHKKH